MSDRVDRTNEAVGGEFAFEAELWEWESRASWTFVSLPSDLSDVLAEVHGEHARGFGSLRVEVAIGGHVWRTSIFPDAKKATYVLPVKKEIRRKAGLAIGDRAAVELTVL